MDKVLSKIQNQVTLSNEEQAKIKDTVKEFKSKLEPVLKKSKIDANLFDVGSGGKSKNLTGLNHI